MEGRQRLWLGPLALVLLVTLIYLFSILPHNRHVDAREHQLYHLKLTPVFVEEAGSARTNDVKCDYKGVFNATVGSCLCLPYWRGSRCSRPVCLNGGWLFSGEEESLPCRCPRGFGGKFCHVACPTLQLNDSTGECKCRGQQFGDMCQNVCMFGKVLQRRCHCDPGYSGPSCSACIEGSPSCPLPPIRRTSINSRLTLSGLSFCFITIGLLCVTAGRRRRCPREEPWLRALAPTRTDCIVQPRISRPLHSDTRRAEEGLSTPPPIYSSTEQLEAPPTYEEATGAVPPQEEEVEVEETMEEPPGDEMNLLKEDEVPPA